MNKIEWIFFDIGYTLVNEDDAWKKRIEEQLKLKLTTEFEKPSADCMLSELYAQTALFAPKFKDVAKKFGYTEFAPFPCEYEKPYDEAEYVLSGLYGKYKLGIIANQYTGLERRLEKYGILRYFDVIICSADVGIEKPDTEIFKIALKNANCEPECSLMVGDRLDNDIAPAKMLGFTTVRVKQGTAAGQSSRSKYEIPDFTVKSLSELLLLL